MEKTVRLNGFEKLAKVVGQDANHSGQDSVGQNLPRARGESEYRPDLYRSFESRHCRRLSHDAKHSAVRQTGRSGLEVLQYTYRSKGPVMIWRERGCPRSTRLSSRRKSE